MPGAATRAKAFAILLSWLVLLSLPGCGGAGSEATGTTGDAAAPTASAAEAASYTFAVMGDSHTDGLDNGILPQAVASARENDAQFIIHTGDVSNTGTREELERYAGFVASAGVPVHSIPGNHDLVSAGDASLFSMIVGPPHSSFEFGGDHFILLDNADESTGIDPGQMEWALEELEAGAESPRQFIFTHVPLGSPDPEVAWLLDEPGYASGAELASAASRHENTAAFFSGHVHGLLRYSLDGIDAWVSGGAGAEPYPSPAIGFHNYLLVRVAEDEVEVSVVRL
ncbi:MAG: hypothetical protein C4534_10940 [Gaiellales bacterium]|nr:MAG: hypothetical protein C4534_10940 [Gaiellales bacterium]